MKQKLLAFLLVLVMVVGLVACAPTTTAPTAATAAPVVEKEQYKMVFIAKGLSHPFSLELGNYAVEAAKKFNIKMDLVGPQTNFSTEEQIALIEDAIAAGVDAILIAPADSVAIVPGIEKANAAGIPIVTPNTKALGGNVLAWTGVENYEVGLGLGEKLAASIDFKGNVVLLEGIPGSSTSTERIAGYNDALAKYPDIKILTSQTANYKRDEGMTIMENILQAYPEIDGIGSADKEMLLGAMEAVKEAGRENIKGVGFDVSEEACTAIKNNEIVAVGNQQPAAQAFWAVAAAWASLEGYSVPAEMYVPMQLIDISNVDECLKLYTDK